MFVARNRLLALTAALALVVPFALAAKPDAAGGKDIVDTAVAGKFTKLAAAVKAAGLVDTLKGKGPFTVFAPTDAAFEALGEKTLTELLADKEKLKAILTYHVVAGNVGSDKAMVAAMGGKSVETVEGSPIRLSKQGGTILLNGKAKVIKADIVTSNGVIHVIDAVILPPVR